jgi:hypothetical protein
MLGKVKELTRYEVRARDGELGKLEDVAFDDRSWQVRYLVIDTGSSPGQRALMHPLVVRGCDPDRRLVELTVSRRQVETSPAFDIVQPASWASAERYYRHFGWPPYWPQRGFGAAAEPGDPHLRSGREVPGWEVQGRDGRIGYVDDLLVDTGLWSIRFLLVSTGEFWSKKAVLLAPAAAKQIDWNEKRVHVDRDRDGIRRGPAWQSAPLLNRL